jgi:hypothetical protein
MHNVVTVLEVGLVLEICEVVISCGIWVELITSIDFNAKICLWDIKVRLLKHILQEMLFLETNFTQDIL